LGAMRAVLLLSIAATAAAQYCEEWCGKNTCHLSEYCGACTTANNICKASGRACLAASCSSSTIDSRHRMCSMDFELCGNSCTCDDFYLKSPPSSPPPLPMSPPGPSPPPMSPPVTCDVGAMNDLKATLQAAIVSQQAKNAALQAKVYDEQVFPNYPPAPPAPPPPTASVGKCVSLWSQCGGKQWAGPTCCSKGSCTYQNEYYSQCRSM